MKIKKVYSVGLSEKTEGKYVTAIFANYDTLKEAEEHLKMLNDNWFIIERYVKTYEVGNVVDPKTDDNSEIGW